MIIERYRSDYTGEFIVASTRFVDGKKEIKREWVDNPITNTHISSRAAIFGPGESQSDFDFTKLQNHQGGLLAKKKLQTYGSDGIYTKMRLDFYVSFEPRELEKITKTDYSENNIVYTSAANCLKYPGYFYLIPYGVRLPPSVTAAWLAAFDQHKEIFLLNFGTVNDKIVQSMAELIGAYPGTIFYYVHNNHLSAPPSWRKHKNFQIMNVNSWVTYCDV